MRVGITGVIPQRRPEMRDRKVVFTLLLKLHADVIVGYRIVLGDRQRMFKESKLLRQYLT